MNVPDVEREHDACGIGFLADLTHKASHDIVRLALDAVGAMVHRGARAADGRTGDGAGMLLETPRALFLRELAESHIRVPERHVAAICLYLPRDTDDAAATRAQVEGAVRANDVAPLRWRTPHVDPAVLGAFARNSAPSYEQLLVDMGPGNVRERMRVVRRAVTRVLRENDEVATLVSASPTTVVYKGLLSSNELGAYFTDLRDPAFASRFAVFHQRFSTNTAPQWRLVQPFNYIAHNGEINTITGNRAWMKARGIVAPRWASDSHDFDTNVDAMVGSGYRIDAAIDMMLSPAVDDERLRAYYDAHIPTVEPWDGPAAMCFTDGDIVGAALDRSGFRPLRWCRTASDKVLCASETGVIDFGDDPIIKRGRLGPGGRIVVRFASGELVESAAFSADRRERADFQPVVRSWHFEMPETAAPPYDHALLERDLIRFGYTKEELKDNIGVIAQGNGEPVSSMGDDASPAFLERRLPVAAFLRQRFAQVTNPPIDSLREGFVFDMRAWVGSGDTNGDVPAPGSIVMLETAILDETAFDSLRFDTRLLQHTIPLDSAGKSLSSCIAAICEDAENAVKAGKSFIVLDDRHAEVPIPAVLAAGAIHQRLTAAGLRMAASIAAADGFARDAHSLATVISAGANVVTPWLALRAAEQSGTRSSFLGTVRTGLIKIMAKLGICTLRSYVGAQTFESLGLGRDVVRTCFPGMKAHVPAVGFDELEEDIRAWRTLADEGGSPPERGLFRFRRDGVRHAFDPNVIKTLRASAMRGDYEAFQALSDAMQARPPITLRDLVEALPLGDASDLETIQPASEIVKHFVTAAMSIGALSPEAHETIAIGAARLGSLSNSGEGGEQARRYCAHARFRPQHHQTGCFGPLRRRRDLSGQRRRDRDQNGSGLEARRRRPDSGFQGLARNSRAARRDARSSVDLAAAASRHLFDRRSGRTDLRFAPRCAASAHRGQTGEPSRDRLRRQRRGESARRRHPHQRSRRRHRRFAAVVDQECRSAVGTGSGRDASRPDHQRPALAREACASTAVSRPAATSCWRRCSAPTTWPSAVRCWSRWAASTRANAIRTPVRSASPRKIPNCAPNSKARPRTPRRFLTFIARDVRRRLARLGARSLDDIHGRSDLLRAALRPRRLGAQHRPERDSAAARTDGERECALRRGAPAHRRPAGLGQVMPIRPADRAVGARVAHQIVERRIRGEAVTR